MAYYVYILRSLKDGRYYIGVTTNIENRLTFHNAGKQRSTRYRRPFQLIKTEKFSTKSEALTKERYLKSLKAGNEFRKIIKRGSPAVAGRQAHNLEVVGANPTPATKLTVNF